MPATAEEEWEYWDARATELRRTQVATVNASAAKWSALTASLLGIFGVVAFAGGLTTLDELVDPFDVVAKVLTTLAVLTGVIATMALAVSAGGMGLRQVDSLNGPTLKQLQATQTGRHGRWLRWGRIAAVVTAGLVVAGSLMVLWVGQDASTDPASYLVILEDGVACGSLEATGSELTVGGVPLSDGVRSVLSVGSCPER